MSLFQETIGPVIVCPICMDCGQGEYVVAADTTERDWVCPVCGGPARCDCELFNA